MEEDKKEDVPEDMWQRGGSETLFTKGLDDMLGLLSSSFNSYTRDVEKEVKNLKKFQ